MKKAILAFSLMLAAGVAAFAQTTAVGDYKKSEFFVGYSNGQVDTGIDSGDDFEDFLQDRVTFHGFEVAGVYNVSRYVGIKGDVSGTYNSTRFTGTFDDPVIGPTTISVDTDNSLYNFLGGVQIKDNASTGRLKPFGHVLAGVGHARTKISDFECSAVGCTDPFEDNFSETGFAAAFGGGLDIRLNNSFDLRAIQVDYNPMWIGGSTQHNVRFGIGLVIK